MKRTWWDRWEEEMHYHPAAAPESGALLAGALAAFLIVALVGAAIVGEYIRLGNLLDSHARIFGGVIMLALVTLAALASVDAKTGTH